MSCIVTSPRDIYGARLYEKINSINTDFITKIYKCHMIKLSRDNVYKKVMITTINND
jgi:hypothetical protein